jgi:predicted ATPase
MDIGTVGEYTVTNLNKINILLGKNGCGKSYFLRLLETQLSSQSNRYGKIKYISPERGGSLIYDAGIEQNAINNPAWLPETRRRNQSTQFRQQSVAQFRNLELLVLREIEKKREIREDFGYNFDIFISEINSLLDRIYIKRGDATKGEISFKIYLKGTNSEITAENISSGESELISLGIECLTFSKEIISEKSNLLILDEPDVHLHPDLQVRLMHFLKKLVDENKDFFVLIASHSTALLGSLESYEKLHIAFMTYQQKIIEFSPIFDIYRKILPVFGAHPLSNIFNQIPILLLEGEDDERIWQQAVRSSQNKIKIYPCSCGSINQLNDFERTAQKIICSVYDTAKAYSLRDRDNTTEPLEDQLPIIRMRLSCRCAENLLLSDEVLAGLGITWDALKMKIDTWIGKNQDHVHYSTMEQFKTGGYNRKNFNLKDIRNDLMGIIGSSKTWEVSVGQGVATLSWTDATDFLKEGSLYNFLGEKIVKNLCPNG